MGPNSAGTGSPDPGIPEAWSGTSKAQSQAWDHGGEPPSPAPPVTRLRPQKNSPIEIGEFSALAGLLCLRPKFSAFRPPVSQAR
ncbi:hypothetical protein YDYSY3_11640 [Paenibacillus chitinolyticus]|nr:hypothetical protein YDYSY3_11640 [Paenibacillus chitinolyticus]